MHANLLVHRQPPSASACTLSLSLRPHLHSVLVLWSLGSHLLAMSACCQELIQGKVMRKRLICPQQMGSSWWLPAVCVLALLCTRAAQTVGLLHNPGSGRSYAFLLLLRDGAASSWQSWHTARCKTLLQLQHPPPVIGRQDTKMPDGCFQLHVEGRG